MVLDVLDDVRRRGPERGPVQHVLAHPEVHRAQPEPGLSANADDDLVVLPLGHDLAPVVDFLILPVDGVFAAQFRDLLFYEMQLHLRNRIAGHLDQVEHRPNVRLGMERLPRRALDAREDQVEQVRSTTTEIAFLIGRKREILGHVLDFGLLRKIDQLHMRYRRLSFLGVVDDDGFGYGPRGYIGFFC